jgi:hypothetical protein
MTMTTKAEGDVRQVIERLNREARHIDGNNSYASDVLVPLMRNAAEFLESLTAHPAPSGWQQRIAAMIPWHVIHGERWCFFCGVSEKTVRRRGTRHDDDCLWQNAVDALPPAPEVKDAIPPGPEGATVSGHARVAIAEICGALSDIEREIVDMPRDEELTILNSIEAVRRSLRTLADASPVKEERDPIASAVRAELQPLEDALIDAGHKLAKEQDRG